MVKSVAASAGHISEVCGGRSYASDSIGGVLKMDEAVHEPVGLVQRRVGESDGDQRVFEFVGRRNPDTCDFAQLVDYEELNRVFILYFIKNLAENEAMYDFSQSFNANMTKIFECDTGMLFFTEKSKIEFLKYLKNLHDKDALVNLVEKWIVFFDAVSANYS